MGFGYNVFTTKAVLYTEKLTVQNDMICLYKLFDFTMKV